MTFPPRAADPNPLFHDPLAIEKLREVDPDGSLVDKWIRQFLREAPGQLLGMRSATEAGVLEEVVAAAHSLKTLAGWLGGVRFWLVCQALERAARREAQDECRRQLSMLRLELPLLEACLAGYLQAGGPAASA